MRKYRDLNSRRWFALGLGVIAALAFLEISLRLLGYVEGRVRGGMPPAAEAGQRTILCAGNSFTLGSGAPPEMSFPSQLQRLLDARYGAGKFRVVNAGVNNLNSSELVGRLPFFLDRYKPELVVFMMGQPDLWNRDGVARFLRGGRWAPELYELLYRLRTFRLLTLLLHDLQSEDARARARFSVAFPEQPLADERILGLKWMGALEDTVMYAPWNLSDDLAAEALAALKRLSELEPNDPLPPFLAAQVECDHYHADDACLQDLEASASRSGGLNMEAYQEVTKIVATRPPGPFREEAKKFLARLSSQIPRGPRAKTLSDWQEFTRGQKGVGSDFEEALAYAKISAAGARACMVAFEAMLRARRELDAVSLVSGCMLRDPCWPWPTFGMTIDQLEELGKKSPELRERVEAFRREYTTRYPTEALRLEGKLPIEEWLRRDLADAIRITREHGANPVFQTYPPQRENGFPPWFPDPVIRSSAAAHGIPLADNYKALIRLFVSPEIANGYYSDQGVHNMHLGPKGNAVVAESLLATLTDSGLLPRN